MNRGRVGVLTTYHLHDDGSRVIYGGAERYGVEFTRMLVEMGFEVAWWQIGSGWTSEIIPGVPLYSLPASQASYQTCAPLNQAFYELGEEIELAVYFTTLLAYPQAHPRSISISHGIYWDYPTWERAVPTRQHREEWGYRWWSALNRPTRIVSCDTATIRYINSTWPGLGNKLSYVPNFVNTEVFGPKPSDGPPDGAALGDNRDRSDVVRVLYPRRLTSVRGIHETVAMIERLSAECPQLEFHVVGRGHTDHHERDMLRWAASMPNVYYYWRSPDGMAKVYRNVDIVLIPTKAAEGTSLSCLEAMASGCAVVAGCTGGLTDLIIDGYNGELVRPVTAASLADAVLRLAADAAYRRRLAERALDTVSAFSLDMWKVRWRRVIDEVFPAGS